MSEVKNLKVEELKEKAAEMAEELADFLEYSASAEAVHDLVRELEDAGTVWNLSVLEVGELSYYFHDSDVVELLDLAYYGNYKPTNEFFRIDELGHYEGFDSLESWRGWLDFEDIKDAMTRGGVDDFAHYMDVLGYDYVGELWDYDEADAWAVLELMAEVLA